MSRDPPSPSAAGAAHHLTRVLAWESGAAGDHAGRLPAPGSRPSGPSGTCLLRAYFRPSIDSCCWRWSWARSAAMTITADTLVPEQLWQAIQPLLPHHHAATAAGPASTTAPPWLASSINCAPAFRGGCCPPGSWAAVAGHLLAAAARLAAAGVWQRSTISCWTSSAARASSTGRGPAWTRQRARQTGGELTGPNPTDRGKPGVQVPPADRPPRRATGRGAVGANRHDSHAAGAHGGRHAGGQGPSGRRSAPSAPGQAARRQGLRQPTLPAGAAPTRDHPADRPAGWSPASGWAAIAGWWSGRWPGWWATGACRCATSDAPTSCWAWCSWRAR